MVPARQLNRHTLALSVLASEPAVSSIVWYEQSEMTKPAPVGFATPVEG